MFCGRSSDAIKNSPFAAPITGNPVDAVVISNAGTDAATFQLTGLVDSDT